MQTLNILTPQWRAGDKIISKIDVTTSPLTMYGKALKAAQAIAPDRASIDKILLRQRIMLQCTAFDASGAKVTLDDIVISSMPAKYAFAIKTAVEQQDAAKQKPEVLTKGDGIVTPIHIKLGTPIEAQGKQIAELEFRGGTYGEIEDILVADESMIDQILALLRIAKPVGADINLMVLPSWAFDQITVADGNFIAQHVLPSFLNQAVA